MRYLLLIAILTTSCGKIKVNDIEIKDSTHTIRHEIVLDGNLEYFQDTCTRTYPDNEKKREACINGYMDVLEGLLDQEAFNTSELVL